MLVDHELLPGTRVRIRAPHFLLTLRTPFGTVVRRESSGWYIIHLDQPATYHDAIRGDQDLPEIRESSDNLEIIGQD